MPNLTPPFGHVDDFWKRYDELAVRSDREMVAHLNGNLNVLLIFVSFFTHILWRSMDNVLIFDDPQAGLFSAINTAFISAAMTALSPNPSDRTNALLELLVLHANNNTLGPVETPPPFSASLSSVIANCLLYASLCCSIIAGVGAMLATEWLQSYSRSGQAGPPEEQGRFRQRKYTASQKWQLERTTLFIQQLIFLSVVLFGTGLILFLFLTNIAVATVVIAFFGVGFALSNATIVAAAIWPLFPYQSSVSRAARRAGWLVILCWKGLANLAKWFVRQRMVRRARERIAAAGRECKTKFGSLLGFTRTQRTTPTTTGQVPRPSSPSVVESGRPGDIDVGNPAVIHHPLLAPPLRTIAQRIVESIGVDTRTSLRILDPGNIDSSEPTSTKAMEQQILNATAVGWLLGVTSSLEDQLMAARNICLVDPMACDKLSPDPLIWSRLLSLTVEAVRSWKIQPTDRNMLVAEQFGAALYHLLLFCPPDHEKWGQIRRLLPRGAFISGNTPVYTLADLAYVLCAYGLAEYRRTSELSHSMWKARQHRQVVEISRGSFRRSVDATPLRAPFDDATLSLLGLLVLLEYGSPVASHFGARGDRDFQVLATQAYTG